MPDKFGKEVRSKIMASIKSKNTTPELLLRKALQGSRLRYQPRLPGNPDLGSKSRKIAIFVNGCFWHGCPWHYKEPKSRKSYWIPKIQRNVNRDRKKALMLKEDGFAVISLWEHEVFGNIKQCTKKIMGKIK